MGDIEPEREALIVQPDQRPAGFSKDDLDAIVGHSFAIFRRESGWIGESLPSASSPPRMVCPSAISRSRQKSSTPIS